MTIFTFILLIFGYLLLGTFILAVCIGEIEDSVLLVPVWPIILVGFIAIAIGALFGKIRLNPFKAVEKLGMKVNGFIEEYLFKEK